MTLARIALTGLGMMGRAHLDALHHPGNAVVVAVADPADELLDKKP